MIVIVGFDSMKGSHAAHHGGRSQNIPQTSTNFTSIVLDQVGPEETVSHFFLMFA